MDKGDLPLPQNGQSNFRAAEYVRMSTEHQQYSTHNQVARIREYAQQRGIEVVKTYADEGKSGLRIAGRLALQQLIEDVESGAADFSMVLAYICTLRSRLFVHSKHLQSSIQAASRGIPIAENFDCFALDDSRMMRQRP